MSRSFNLKPIEHTLLNQRFNGVRITMDYANYTNRVYYLRQRNGLIVPIDPVSASGRIKRDLSGIAVTCTWFVNSKRAGDEFIAINKTLNDVDEHLRELIKRNFKKTTTGYMVSISYLISEADLNEVDEMYVHTLDVLIGANPNKLSPHPYSERGIAITNALPDGQFVISVKINDNRPNTVYWLAAVNGVYPIAATYDPNLEEPKITIYSGENSKTRTGKFITRPLKEALEGEEIKIFSSKELANAFLNGDQTKIKLLEAEIKLKETKIEQARIDQELSVNKAEMEHAYKMETLMVERKNTNQKGIIETIKLIPIIGGIFGLVASIFGF